MPFKWCTIIINTSFSGFVDFNCRSSDTERGNTIFHLNSGTCTTGHLALEYQAQFTNNLFLRKTVMYFEGLSLYFKIRNIYTCTCNHRSDNVKIENKITNESYIYS